MKIVLPKRVKKQPRPFLYEGGDCGACVLGGLFSLSCRQVYHRFVGLDPEPFTWSDMRKALHRARYQQLADRLIDSVPHWPRMDAVRIWGEPSWTQNLRWFEYAVMALDAGYYGVACVDLDQRGPFVDGDHWVLICGAKKTSERISEEASRIDQHVLISCSSTKTPDEEWVEVVEFLQKRGGFNSFFVRPAAEDIS